MKTSLFRAESDNPAALAALAHPVAIGAAVALLLNDCVWQRWWPSIQP